MSATGGLTIRIDEMHMTDVLTSVTNALCDIGLFNVHVEQICEQNDIITVDVLQQRLSRRMWGDRCVERSMISSS